MPRNVCCRHLAALLPATALDGLAGRIRRLERIVEQIGGVLSPQNMKGEKEGFQQIRVGEQIGAVPVPQIWEPLGEAVQPLTTGARARLYAGADFGFLCASALGGRRVTPLERVQNPFPIVGVPVPQLVEAVVEVTPQECVLNRTQEQIVGVPLPQPRRP